MARPSAGGAGPACTEATGTATGDTASSGSRRHRLTSSLPSDLAVTRITLGDAKISRAHQRLDYMYLFHLRPNLAGDPTFVGNFLTQDECKRIIDAGERALKLGPGRVDGERIDASIRKSDIGWMSPQSEHRWLFDRIKACVNDVNADWFRYDLIGFEGIQFAKYSGTDGQSGFYASHVDLMATDFGTIRKLSFSIQLSPPEAYDGGDVLLYRSLTESSAVSKAVGSITFFPSYTIHEVLPVTSGIRYSLVGWAHGPAFV